LSYRPGRVWPRRPPPQES